MSPRRRDPARFARALALAAERDGVISRLELADLGLDRFAIRDMVAAGRWRVLGRQAVCVHTGELTALARWWWAVIDAGPEIAALDGVSALIAGGAKTLTEREIHLSVRHASRPLPQRGVRVHQVRAWSPHDVLHIGPPRVRPEIAAIRAAHWAVSDRQAALFLCVVIQQRLVTPHGLQRAAVRVNGRRRRAFIRQVVFDLADGAQSLGELDFARLCRDRGLPEPDRQVVRHGPRGRIYLDVRWQAIKLVVEIDGAQHRQGLNVSDDNLRHNAVVIGGDTVLRIDLVGFRLWQTLFMDQVVEAHRVLGARVA